MFAIFLSLFFYFQSPIHSLTIEDAISVNEIISKGYFSSDEALKELKRAKDKLDLGLIKPEQYDSIKSKLLKFIK